MKRSLPILCIIAALIPLLSGCSLSGAPTAAEHAAMACGYASMLDNEIAGTGGSDFSPSNLLELASDEAGQAASADKTYDVLAMNLASMKVAANAGEKSTIMFLLQAETECMDLGLLEDVRN